MKLRDRRLVEGYSACISKSIVTVHDCWHQIAISGKLCDKDERHVRVTVVRHQANTLTETMSSVRKASFWCLDSALFKNAYWHV